MRQLMLILIVINACSCGFNNKIDIPNRIDAVASGETTVRVVHTVEISAELQQIFRAECESLAIQAGFIRDTPEFETFVSTCVTEKSNKFMQDFLDFIQSQQKQQNGQ